MTFILPPLPYAIDALAPHISAETLEFHHGKHHQSYVTNLNNLTVNTPQANMSLVDLIQASYGKDDQRGIFNNAAQIWNHTFYWQSMQPNGGGQPTGLLLDYIVRDFGSFDGFKDDFIKAGISQFGSGYVWLVMDADGRLSIRTTGNAACPLTDTLTPLLTCDLWEHAYYIDYRNRRPEYLAVFLASLANWTFAVENFQKSR